VLKTLANNDKKNEEKTFMQVEKQASQKNEKGIAKGIFYFIVT